MTKISSIVLYILAGISVVLALMFYLGPSEKVGSYDAPVFTSQNLIWAGVLFAVTVAITLVFALVHIITHPKALRGAVIALVSAGVLILVAYLLSSDAPVNSRGVTATGTTLKLVDTGLYVTYILAGLALLGIILSEVVRAFR